jgi:hypothetical protein
MPMNSGIASSCSPRSARTPGGSACAFSRRWSRAPTCWPRWMACSTRCWSRCNLVGDTLYYGRGAGRLPTASAVLSDVADLATTLAGGRRQRLPPFLVSRAPPSGRLANTGRRLVPQLPALHPAGPAGRAGDRVGHVLGRHEISISSVIQKESRNGSHVPVVFMTHAARERNMCAALAELDRLEVVGAPGGPVWRGGFRRDAP